MNDLVERVEMTDLQKEENKQNEFCKVCQTDEATMIKQNKVTICLNHCGQLHQDEVPICQTERIQLFLDHGRKLNMDQWQEC
jgi:hypothetical protein